MQEEIATLGFVVVRKRQFGHTLFIKKVEEYLAKGKPLTGRMLEILNKTTQKQFSKNPTKFK